MPLELTPEQAERLKTHLNRCKNKGKGQSKTISFDRKRTIIALVKVGLSNEAIKRLVRTSDQKINELKKENGLWGV